MFKNLGRAFFSPACRAQYEHTWVHNGGAVAREKHDYLRADIVFCAYGDPKLVENYLIVRHPSWIEKCIEEEFLVPVAPYILDDQFVAPAATARKRVLEQDDDTSIDSHRPRKKAREADASLQSASSTLVGIQPASMIPSAFRFPTRAFPPGPSKLSTSIVPDVEKEKENAPRARNLTAPGATEFWKAEPAPAPASSSSDCHPPRTVHMLPAIHRRHCLTFFLRSPAPDNVADALPQLPTGCFRTSIRKLRERPRPVAVVFDINTTFEGKAFAMEAR
ncbi:Branched-chain-amino-acid aminotransferase [Mycena kentingensis (nom. inval.)]|nr:Branched-chain-amino-acid aminotransferase [Mycena kentingensis (nom. inval.)]